MGLQQIFFPLRDDDGTVITEESQQPAECRSVLLVVIDAEVWNI